MTTRYLADTSAISRLQRQKTAARWTRAVTHGVIAVCDPVELEVLRWIPGGADRRAMKRVLAESYSWLPVPDDAWQRARALQDELGDRGQHNSASVVDLVVAVTAIRHQVAVLHDDADYEVISRFTGLPVQRVTE
jgi:predicted nucleic acid-binding protein